MGSREELKIKIIPDMPTKYPRIEDLVGVSRKFADNLVNSIEHGKIYEMLGVQPNKSFMLSGPPGTGKTFSLQAINNSMNKLLYDIKPTKEGELQKAEPSETDLKMFMVSYDIGRYGSSYINGGSRIIQKFFDIAYMLSLQKPTVVKIDEADALLTQRGSIQSHAEDRKNLETLMKNLQAAHDTKDMYVVMMTNHVDYVDKAVLRAGRVDKRYFIDYATLDERKKLFKQIIKTRNDNAVYNIIRNYDVNKLADLSEGFSNADIAAVVEKTLKEKALKLIKDKKPGIICAGYINGTWIEKEIDKHRKDFYEKKKKIGF